MIKPSSDPGPWFGRVPSFWGWEKQSPNRNTYVVCTYKPRGNFKNRYHLNVQPEEEAEQEWFCKQTFFTFFTQLIWRSSKSVIPAMQCVCRTGSLHQTVESFKCSVKLFCEGEWRCLATSSTKYWPTSYRFPKEQLLLRKKAKPKSSNFIRVGKAVSPNGEFYTTWWTLR